MSRRILSRAAERVAPRLLGSHITSRVGGQRVTLRLTEVEAYGGVGNDPGSHAFRRRTPRNETMFGAPGELYVYFTYGMHWCVNIVTEREGVASAVLLRAGAVIEGVEHARARRATSRRDSDLASGPARLAVALGISGSEDGQDVLGAESPVRLILRPPVAADAIGSSARTGVSGAGASIPWRFYLRDDPTVSRYRPA